MKRGKYSGILLVCGLFLMTGVSWGAKSKVGVVDFKADDYSMIQISKHTPWGAKSAKKYLNSLQKIELKTGNQSQFKDLPSLGLRNPYTGYIKLGDQDQKFGFIVDIFGEEKRLYIDTDGDGSFAGETYTLLLNEWYGAQIYWVMGPEPIKLKVRYKSKNNRVFPIEINVSGYIFNPGFAGKEKPFLLVEVRTWFLAKVNDNGVEKLVAVGDQNNNGRFNDKEDALFIDYDNDGFFGEDEIIIRKRGVKLKGNKQKFIIDWGVYPDTLQVKGGNR